MEFIDKLAMPVSGENILLLKYLLALSYLILLPYITLLLGGSVYSQYFLRKSQTDHEFLTAAKKSIVPFASYPSYSIIFGLIPVFTIMFIYAQLFQSSDFHVLGYLTVALFLMFFGSGLIFRYARSSAFETEKTEIPVSVSISGVTGSVLLFVAMWALIGIFIATINPDEWGGASFFGLLFSVETLVNLISFILLSLALTSVALVYYYFRPSSGFDQNDEGMNFIREFYLKSGILFSSLLPVFFLAGLLLFSSASLSLSVFILSLLMFIAAVIIANQLFNFHKGGSAKLSASALFMIFILFALVIIRTSAGFGMVFRAHSVQLNAQYEEYQNQLSKDLNITAEN